MLPDKPAMGHRNEEAGREFGLVGTPTPAVAR
jgi:hypothetical protein